MAAGRFTLIQQNDIHAQMEPHPEHFWRGGSAEYRRTGGLAAAAAIVQRIRRTAPDALLVDCGDAIHGTLPAMRTQGAAVVPALNALGVQLMTPGNWEYGFGPDALRARMSELDATVLACNVEDAADGSALFAPWAVRETAGVRVGFVGVTSPIIPGMSPRFAAGLRFPDVRRRVPQTVARLRERERVDVVVLVSHLGFAQDAALVREIGGIDVVLSGHTHNRLDRPALVGGALIIQSGFSGSFLGRLTLDVTSGRIHAWEHELIEIDAAVQPEPAVQDVVEHALAPFRAEMAEVVGETATPLDRMGLLETTMDNLITDAYRDLTDADIAFSHGWRFAPPVAPGPVTAGDLWAMVPTNPRLFTARIRGAALRGMLEQNLQEVFAADALQQAGGYIIRTSGLSVVFRPNNGRGIRIEHIDVNGTPLADEREYSIVGGGRRHFADASGREELDVRAIDALRRYLGRQQRVDAALTHRKFIAQ